MFHCALLGLCAASTDRPLEAGCCKCRHGQRARSLEERVSRWLQAPGPFTLRRLAKGRCCCSPVARARMTAAAPYQEPSYQAGYLGQLRQIAAMRSGGQEAATCVIQGLSSKCCCQRDDRWIRQDDSVTQHLRGLAVSGAGFRLAVRDRTELGSIGRNGLHSLWLRVLTTKLERSMWARSGRVAVGACVSFISLSTCSTPSFYSRTPPLQHISTMDQQTKAMCGRAPSTHKLLTNLS